LISRLLKSALKLPLPKLCHAREYADSLHGLRLRLVDGRELASLMVDCGLGVSEGLVYRMYRIESDLFEERE
jgi:restriction endonuclease Mrr